MSSIISLVGVIVFLLGATEWRSGGRPNMLSGAFLFFAGISTLPATTSFVRYGSSAGFLGIAIILVATIPKRTWRSARVEILLVSSTAAALWAGYLARNMSSVLQTGTVGCCCASYGVLCRCHVHAGRPVASSYQQPIVTLGVSCRSITANSFRFTGCHPRFGSTRHSISVSTAQCPVAPHWLLRSSDKNLTRWSVSPKSLEVISI